MIFDVTLIGNGAIASALALRFSHQHPELRLALVGPAPRPACASLAAGAMLNVFAELEAGALDAPLARARFDAAVHATLLWQPHLDLLNSRLGSRLDSRSGPRLDSHLAATPPVRVVAGTYVVAADERDSATLDAIAGYLAEYRQRFREVDPRAIPGLRPAPHARPRRALYLEDEGMVSARSLHRAYDEAFADTPQVTRFDTEATAILPSGDASRPTTTVRTRAGAALATCHVIIAAGARTQELVEQLGLAARIPRLVHDVGVSLVLKTPAALPQTVVRTPRRGLACGLYLVPYQDGHCYVGATSELSAVPPAAPSAQAVQYLLRGAREQVSPELAGAEQHKTLVASRPTTLDGYPLLGRTSIEGVWIASGTRRDGFHLSPKIAAELVAAVASGAQPFAGAFPPERRLLLPAGKQPAIDRAVEQRLAAASTSSAASGTSAPGAAPPTAEAVRASVEETYAQSGLANEDLGIPAELLDLYRQGLAADNIAHLLATRRRAS